MIRLPNFRFERSLLVVNVRGLDLRAKNSAMRLEEARQDKR
jgi:hypothetical protein